MPATVPAYRSILFTACHWEGLEQRLAGTAADALMLDLEDGVPLDQKPLARRQAAAFLAEDRGLTTFLRVNTAASGLIEADLEGLGPAVTGVILPKAEQAEDLRRLDALLGAREPALGREVGSIALLPLIETCAGALDALSLAKASPRVLTLGIGASDFMADLGLPNDGPSLDPEPLDLPRRMLILAARAAGRTGCFDGGRFVPGTPGWREACEAVRRLGYRGKVCFSEEQAAEANTVFAATA